MAEQQLVDPTRSAKDGPLSEEHGQVDLVAVFRELRNGWDLILGVTSVALIVAVGLAFLLPVRYTSDVSFIPPSINTTSSMASAIAGQLSTLGAGSASDLMGGMKNPGDLYAGILKSRSIAEKLINRFDLIHLYGARKESQAQKILASATDVTTDTKSSIVTLSVTASTPGLAHDLAAAYMETLRDTTGSLALTQASQKRLFYGEQLSREKDELANAEVELKKTQEQSGLIAPAGQTEAQIRTIAETQAQLAARQVQLAALRQSATEQNPQVISLQSEISDLQSQLTKLQHGSDVGSTLSIPTSKVPGVELEYVRKFRDVKYHEVLFEALSKQYEAARLDEARDAPVLQILDPPSYPDSKSSPKRGLISLAGLVLGLFLGCVGVLFKNRRIRA